jgi:hypothetical protein
LVEGLTAQQSDADFNALLNDAAQSIFEASTVKAESRKRIITRHKDEKAA